MIDANELATLLAEKLSGRLPKVEQSTITLSELFEVYYRNHLVPHTKTFDNARRCFQSYLSHWAERRAEEITRAEIQSLVTELGTSGRRTTANRVVQLIRPMFNKGRIWGLLNCSNPAVGVQLYRLKSRDRFLQFDELGKFFEAVSRLRYDATRDALLLMLFTGARRGNICAMRFEEIDWHRKVWTIPKTKNGGSQIIPLVEPAMAILLDRKNNAKSEWVFPSVRSRKGHLTKLELAWKVVLEDAGIANLRPHDLRRTLGSWEALTGTDVLVIRESLGHKDIKSTMVYARLNLDPVRKAMDTAVAAMVGTSQNGAQRKAVSEPYAFRNTFRRRDGSPKAAIHWDPEVPALGTRSNNGGDVWCVKLKVNGKQILSHLGSTSSLTLEEARTLAILMLDATSAG